jgi:putative NIF3 family GTP cyclohydrolase 1 type 2
MHCGGIRHSILQERNQKKGCFRWSRKFCHKNAIQAGADAYLTADLKYHQFYEAEPTAISRYWTF